MSSNRDMIIKKLDGFTHLPSMNETANKVIELLNSPDSHALNATAIGKVIEKDMGLTAKILKIANSVFYSGKYGQIGDVGQAVARLGIIEVSQICTTVTGFQLFSNTAGTVDLKEFWKHSLGVAIVMRYIAEKSRQFSSFSANAYVAGLFHDIGILVLDRYFSAIYSIVLEAGKNRTLPLFSAERETLEIDHGEIGELLCKKWKLPEEICCAVAWHHTPDACPAPYRSLSQLIHIANFTCSVLGIPEPGDCAVSMGSEGAWHDLGLDNCDLKEMADQVEEDIARSGAFVSLAL